MKILYITGENIFLNQGGARHSLEVAKTFTKLGHNLTLVSPLSKIKQKKISPFKVIFLQMTLNQHIFNWLAAKKLFSLFKQNKFDVILERYYFTGGIGALLSKLKNIPYFLEVNNPHLEEFIYFNSKYKPLKPLLYLPTILQMQIAKKIFTINKNIIPKNFQNKTLEVRWGVEEEFINFKPRKIEINNLRKNLNLQNNFVVGYVGSFQKWQGIKQMPAIINKVIKKNKKVIFVLIGKGELFNWFSEKIKDNNLGQNVKILGEIIPAELPKFISIFNLGFAPFFIPKNHPLQTLGFYYCPLKILEYLALNKFVLTSDFPVLNNILSKKTFGKTVVPTINNFAEEILNYSYNKKLIANGAQQYIKNNLTWTVHCKYLMKILNKEIK